MRNYCGKSIGERQCYFQLKGYKRKPPPIPSVYRLPPDPVRRRCKPRNNRVEKKAADTASGVQRQSASVVAANRRSPANAYRLLDVGDNQLFSVSTTTTKERVVVTFETTRQGAQAVDIISCTDTECKR